MFNKEKLYHIPDVRQPLVNMPARRHYLILRDAMIDNDLQTIGNRQLRLLKGGYEVPISLKQCNRLLE